MAQDDSKYSKPELRESIKDRVMAGSKGGKPGQWSARKAQLVAQEYEKAGGGYRGGKGEKQKSLEKWGKEKWMTKDEYENAVKLKLLLKIQGKQKMNPRQVAQKFLSNFNLQNAEDKIIRAGQLSKDSGGYELPGAVWRQMVTETEEESKQIPSIAQNKIVNRTSIQQLRQIEQQRKIQQHKQNIRYQAHEALLKIQQLI